MATKRGCKKRGRAAPRARGAKCGKKLKKRTTRRRTTRRRTARRRRRR